MIHPARTFLTVLATLAVVGCGDAEQNVPSAAAKTPLEAISSPRFVEGTTDPDTFVAGYGEFAAAYARFDLEELLADSGTPGVAIAVFEDYEIVWTYETGIADLETGRAVDADTLFQAASISKPVGAAAVLKATEEGLFTLDTPINEILDRWQLPENSFTDGRPVTPRDLLTHTAGTTMPGFPGYDPAGPIATELGVVDEGPASNTAAVRVDVTPGLQYRYSGGGTTVLQVALADAVGKPYRDILGEWVLGPAGMAASGYDQPMSGERADRAARAHFRPDSTSLDRALQGAAVTHANAVRGTAPWHAYPELQAAGLWTTPSDLARFAIDIGLAVRGDSGRILTPAAAREMTTRHSVGEDGLGWAMQNRGAGDEEVWYFSHSGGNWGFRCYLVTHREDGYGAAIMINGDNFEVILELIRRIGLAWKWEGDLVAPPR